MATRRTTLRSQTGTKLYAVRDESGKIKDIQTYQRAHGADLRHKSKAEVEATQGPIEKKVRKAASDAINSVKSSVKGAVTAVQRVAKQAVKHVSGRQPPKKKAVTTVAAKAPRTPTAAKTAKKSARKPAAKKF